MNHIPTFGEFSASLNESIETFNINSIEDLSTIDDIIKVTEAMNQSDPIMWRGMSTKDPNFRYSSSGTFVHLVADRTSFRGGNPGAAKMMSYLKLKNQSSYLTTLNDLSSSVKYMLSFLKNHGKFTVRIG